MCFIDVVCLFQYTRYRERLSLRELVFIALREHGLNIPRVVSLTGNLITAWREDCWDGLYNYLDKPSEGDALYSQFSRPFEVCAAKMAARPCLCLSFVPSTLSCLYCSVGGTGMVLVTLVYCD